MYIRCWGSRGSVPVSGRQYIKYGGDTTCIEIRTKENNIIIIDAGTGIRRLGNKLIREKVSEFHIIFTHAHWDHIMGFPFFKPLYKRSASIKMYRCPIPKFVKTMLSTVMTPPYFPISYSEVKANIVYAKEINDDSHFKIGNMSITSIPLSHPNTGRGYKFEEDGKSFVFLTDNELLYNHPGRVSYESYIEFSAGADLLIHDAEYTKEEYDKMITWGHSSYTHAVDFALDAKVKRLGLFHLNQDRTDNDMDEIVKKSEKIITSKGGSFKCFGVSSDMEMIL